MNKDAISDELINACQKLVKELNRVEETKKKRAEAEKEAEAQREARREYWKQKLYSEDSKAMTFIVPDDSKLKK